MNLFPCAASRNHLVRAMALLFSLLSLGRALAQPTITRTTPFNNASGVAVSTSVVITFSEAMNTSATLVFMLDSTTYQVVSISVTWDASHTVLTCTPTAVLPEGRTFYWTVMNGQNPAGAPLTGTTGGAFTTIAPLQLKMVNATWNGGTFAFDVTSQAGQTLTVEYSSTMRTDQWQSLLTTNTSTGRVHIVDPNSSTNRYLFYRARTGS